MMLAFTFSSGKKLTGCIMHVKERGGEPQLLEDDRLDFKDTKTVLVKNELYVFKEGCPVSAYKIAYFTSTDHLVKITLSTLPRNEYLNLFP